jgi:hypothetical protein
MSLLFEDPWLVPGGELMKFRLTYEGLLESRANAQAKHGLRKRFHSQIKRLWEVNPGLVAAERAVLPESGPIIENEPLWANMARQREFARNGYNFLPLCLERLHLSVSLDILFLRQGRPGSVILRGDIDNRLKTLFDGLRMPRDKSELGGFINPDPDEEPFFVLLEDDSQITQVSVETDDLLQPLDGQPYPRMNDARLVMTVEIHPRAASGANLHLS